MENPFEIILEKLYKIEQELLAIKANQEYISSGMNKEYLTVNELSEYINLAVQTIYGHTSANRIPYVKRGKKLFFKKTDIDVWIEKGQSKTIEEMAANYLTSKGKTNQ